jgi:putative endopeptidase
MRPLPHPRALLTALVVLALPVAATAQTTGPARTFMDTTCAPCRDFFQYANGTWLKTAEMPAAYVAIGATREMADHNQEALRRVLDHAAEHVATEKDPSIRKLGWFYAVLMDSARADREGGAPVAEDLKRIDGIKTKADLAAEFARSSLLGRFAPFRFGPEPDPKSSQNNIGRLAQGGLGLPDRDYYFRTDPKSDSLRRDYVAHIGRTLQLFGETAEQAQADADRVLKLETALAESSLSRVQMRDPKALYHKITVKELGALSPALDWPAFFAAVGVKSLADEQARLDVSMPTFMRQLSALVDRTPLEDWRAYLKYQTVRGAMPWLGQAYFDEAFRLQARMLGQKQPQVRWKRAASAVDNAMGEALGKAYVELEFPPSSKARMLELVDNLQATFQERIASRPWMSDATKQQATTKLNAILKKIGYPDQWRDYSTLDIDPKLSAVDNLRRAQAFERNRRLAQIGTPVDRNEWDMSPPTVNAYYSPPTNEIAFPAGILTPPEFDPKADDAANYGAIGSVIGHELTHGFDDEGRQYDAVGNLKDWWTAEDGKKFDERAQRVVEQYNGYIAVDTLHINGKLTLGENIADIGGLTIAYYAWQRSLKGKPAPAVVDGFTAEQRFFLSFAQSWRVRMRPELTRLVALSDPHSPAAWRVNGTVSNMPEFTKAFGCKAGDPMVLDDGLRAGIW